MGGPLRMVGLAVALLGVTAPAAAEEGRIDLRVEAAAGGALVGPTRPAPEAATAAGAVGGIAATFRLVPNLHLDVGVNVGAFGRSLPTEQRTGTRFTAFTLGLMVRFLNDRSGFLDDEGGNWRSRLWTSARIGFHRYDGTQFGADLSIGYDFSLPRPWNLGPFLRFSLMGGGESDGPDGVLVGGLSVSFQALGPKPAADRDRDGVPDEDELALGLDPDRRDTDRDGIDDGIELAGGTDPAHADTDNDGLDDGDEDRDHDGRLDPDETDPRRSDTDEGGMGDLSEVRRSGQDAQNAADDDLDGDGVANDLDTCPETPEGSEVDPNGCLPATEPIALEGVTFRSGSARLAPTAEEALFRALDLLRRYPRTRFEIAGHTDDRGGRRENLRLSQRRAATVLRWFVEHGLDAARFEVRGYGSSRPRASNRNDAGRRRNRRIELRRLP